MQKRRFIQCDVFSPLPLQGNGLAVVVDAEGLSDELFQRFAAWTNLAETTFILPPQDPVADYRLRIYTPSHEMLFAGHPTLGSCAAWLHAGGVAKQESVIRQECGVGIVEIDTTGSALSFVAPPTKIEALADERLEAITRALDISPESVLDSALLDNGPRWQVLQLETAEQVLALDSSLVSFPEFNPIGLIGAHPAEAECDFEVRMISAASGMTEDPITGSLNAALAQWFYADGRLSREITVAQGTVINRHGRVSIRPDTRTGKIFIGGDTHILIDGYVSI